MSHWIRHHAPLFDRVLMVEEGAVTDGSREVALAEAPGHWESRFGPRGEARKESGIPPDAWQIELTPNEFLVHPDVRELVKRLDTASAVNPDGVILTASSSSAVRLPCYVMAQGDTPLPERFTSPLLQRTRILVPSGSAIESRLFSSMGGRTAGTEMANISLSGFVARFGVASDSGGARVVDLREVSANEDSHHSGETLGAQLAWYRFFAQDAPVTFARAQTLN